MPALEQLDQLQHATSDLQEKLPFWIDMIAAFLGFWGLMMWLFGRKLIKASVTATGLVLGATAAALIFNEKNPDLAHRWMWWAAGGALLGAVAFYLLLRLWMAVTLALIVGLVAPVAFAAWQGAADDNAQQLGDAIGQTINEGLESVTEKAGQVADKVRQGSDDAGDSQATDDIDLAKEFSALFNELLHSVKQWWSNMDSGSRWLMSVLAAAGVAIGLVVGFLLPNTTTSLVTSMMGSGLLLIALNHLGGRYAPSLASHLPNTIGSILVALGIATVIGTAFQWMISRRSADNG